MQLACVASLNYSSKSYMIICEVGIKMISLEFKNYWHCFVKSMFVYLSCK